MKVKSQEHSKRRKSLIMVVVKHTRYLEMPLQTLRMTGLLIEKYPDSRWRNYSAKFQFFFTCSAFFGGFMIQLVGLFTGAHELTALTEVSLTMIPLLMTLVKVTSTVYRIRSVRQLVDLIENDFEQDTTTLNQESIWRVVKHTNRFISAIFYLCVLACFAYITIPVHELAQKDNTTELHDLLPLKASYQYDLEEERNFLITYLLETWVIINALLLVPCFDVFVVSLVAHGSAQYEILKKSLRNLRKEAIGNLIMREKNISERPKEIEEKEDMVKRVFYCNGIAITRERLDSEMLECLKKYVIYHNYINNYIALLSKTFQIVFLAQIQSSLLMICVTGFQIIKYARVNMAKSEAIAVYLSFQLLELFMFCWSADMMSKKSEEVSQSAYDLPWCRSGSKVRQALQFVMVRAQKPVIISVAGLHTLNLQMFGKIINTSYQFLAIMQKMAREEELYEELNN